MNLQERYAAVPEEMKALPNWVCYKAVPDPKSHSGVSKKPVNPFTGELAKPNDKNTWSDYKTALSASVHFAGLGFMFGESPFFGVDLDDMTDELKDFEKGGEGGRIGEFINALGSYTEYSQSGHGIHIICRGSLPDGARHKGSIEMYETGRFFVVTGKVCGDFTQIKDCTETIKPLHKKYLSGGRKEASPRREKTPNDMTVDEIISAAVNAKNGSKFSKLLSGDISDYGSASEADMAFCNLLAFWTGCDVSKMDDIFRKSGLMRDKWDEKRGASSYGERTITKAIEACTETYSSSSSEMSAPIVNYMKPKSRKVVHYSMDDMGNAERFVANFGDTIRYNYTDKKWLYYSGKKWVTDFNGTSMRCADASVHTMKDELKHYLETDGEESDIYKAFQKHIKTSRSHKSKENFMKEVQHHVPVMPSQLDKYKMVLNTPGGVVNLTTGEIKPHKPEFYLTKITKCEQADDVNAPLWAEFLRTIFKNDLDLIRYIQKAIGYTLTGSTVEECVFFLYGTGRNGKSTFLEIIREIFGDYAANIQPETIMVKPNASSAINSDIARLKGARLVTSVEPNEGVRLNEGLLKQLTGQDIITARKLYGEEFEFKPEFKLWMATNHKPIIRGTDTGIWRRIHLIPFTATIPPEKVDKDLRHKLQGELPQIFRWALDGCMLWQREGLEMPRAVLDSVKEYRREMDVISAFIDDKCELTGATQSSVLYAAYSSWAEGNNEYKMSMTKFSLELQKRNFEKVKTKGFIYFNGISLTR